MNAQSVEEQKVRVFLPKNVIHGGWEILVKWGLSPTGIEQDDLQEVDLPSGWALTAQTEGRDQHVLTDTRQCTRAIYFTDSRDLVLCKRYDFVLRSAPTQFAFRKMHWYEVIDADGQVLFRTGEVADPKLEATHHAHEVFDDMRKEFAQKAQEWLDSHYPRWEDPTAYWD